MHATYRQHPVCLISQYLEITMRTVLIFLLSIFFISAKAQSNTDSVGVAGALNLLVQASRNIDRKPAAALICYRGNDKSRVWKSPAIYSNEDEKRGVNNVCDRINRLTSNSYHIISYSTETESEGTWLLLKVDCSGIAGKGLYYFAFLKVKGSYLLGDIDRHNGD